MKTNSNLVIPTKAQTQTVIPLKNGISKGFDDNDKIPTCVGMTKGFDGNDEVPTCVGMTKETKGEKNEKDNSTFDDDFLCMCCTRRT